MPTGARPDALDWEPTPAGDADTVAVDDHSTARRTERMQLNRSLTVVAEPDVLVVGCGCAGTVAAIAAARRGADTLVVERAGYAGGYITNVVGASLDGFTDLRTGLPVVGGIAFDFVRRAAVTDAAGDLYNTRFRFNAELGQMRSVIDRAYIRFDIERFKSEADRLLRQAGARVLYHTVVADVLCSDGHLDGVVLANKAGLTIVRPKAVVDASGDADVAAFAGASCEQSFEAPQPMSLHFRIGRIEPKAELRDACSQVLARAHAEGLLPLYAGPWMVQLDADDLCFNATRLTGNPVDPDDLSRAEMQGREDARLMFELFKEHIPAFENAYFVATGPAIGVRESRRVSGLKTLTVADIHEHRTQADAVCLGGWWLDRHPTDSSGYHPHTLVRPYDIAYGTLVSKDLCNLWVAGRCHSAESAALASSRVTVTCMGMGQAAGTAAALATQKDRDAREVDVAALQSALFDDGAILLERAEETRRVGDEAGAVELPGASD